MKFDEGQGFGNSQLLSDRLPQSFSSPTSLTTTISRLAVYFSLPVFHDPPLPLTNPSPFSTLPLLSYLKMPSKKKATAKTKAAQQPPSQTTGAAAQQPTPPFLPPALEQMLAQNERDRQQLIAAGEAALSKARAQWKKTEAAAKAAFGGSEDLWVSSLEELKRMGDLSKSLDEGLDVLQPKIREVRRSLNAVMKRHGLEEMIETANEAEEVVESILALMEETPAVKAGVVAKAGGAYQDISQLYQECYQAVGDDWDAEKKARGALAELLTISSDLKNRLGRYQESVDGLQRENASLQSKLEAAQNAAATEEIKKLQGQVEE